MEKTKNVFGAILLFLVLVIFVVGGYVLMKYMTKEPVENKPKEVEKEEKHPDIRLDKTKGYIYYENEEDIIENLDIRARDAYFNLASMSEINSVLKQEHDAIRKTIKYVEDMGNIKLDGLETNDEGIYSLEYREYYDYSYDEYVSLLICDYYYDIKDGVIATNLYAYVVDKNSGFRVTADELLDKYDLDMDKVKQMIRKRLVDTQTISDEEQTINIDETLNNLSSFAIYINKNGKLAVSFIVKTNKNNYNDSIELN